LCVQTSVPIYDPMGILTPLMFIMEVRATNT
jgi:hypothetical protein